MSKENPHVGHRERVRRRYASGGLEPFAPHEVLEFLLFHCVQRQDTNELAHRLIDRFGSVSGVLAADRELLMSVDGVGESIAAFFGLLRDLKGYCINEDIPFGTSLAEVEEQVRFLQPRFENLTEEEVWMISLDAASLLIGVHKVSEGTPMGAEIHIRTVLRHALADDASRVVLAHNHPSGFAIPSRKDIDATTLIAKTLQAAGIRLHDHLVFARGGDCVSFKQTRTIREALLGETIGPVY